MAQFEVGKEYKTRSIGDYNCIFTILITGRTAKTVSYNYLGRSRRSMIHVDQDGEWIQPDRYSMAPTFRARAQHDKGPRQVPGASLLPLPPPCGRILAGKGVIKWAV